MTILEQLTRDEGVRLQPYRDSVGKLTIGIGRNLEDVGISRDEAEYLLQNDVKNVQAHLYQNLPWIETLDDARLGVLQNMAFNLGISGLLEFRQTLGLIQVGDYAGASRAMLESKWAEQVGSRAQRLAIQLESGVWQ